MIKISAVGAFSMAFTIILGAFGAHWLGRHLEPERMAVMETGLKYQMIHSLSLAVLPLLFHKMDIAVGREVWFLQMTGIVLFCFSLYLLSVRNMIGIPNATWLGMITPLGGLSFILSWILLGIKLIKQS